MKSNIQIAIIFILAFGSNPCLFAQPGVNNLSTENRSNFHTIQESFDRYWDGKQPEKGSGYKQFKRWEDFWRIRVDKEGNFPDAKAILRQWNEIQHNKQGNAIQGETADWQPLGPFSKPQNKLSYESSGLGRVNCVAFHPSNPNIIWVGAASGGAWFSNDNGATWNEVPVTQFLTIGITDIAISESDPDIMYMATGDANGIGMTRAYSLGVLKSVDGGKTWNETGFARDISEKALCSRLLINPETPDIVYTATTKGIFKSIDGGQDWEMVSPNYYFRDMEFKPGDANVIYASTYSSNATVFISRDAGQTWQQNNFVYNSNRIALAVSAEIPSLVYALCSRNGKSDLLGLYKSLDSGESWELISNSPNILGNRITGSSSYNLGWYALAFTASPSDSDILFAGSINNWRSTDGGASWTAISEWQGAAGLPYVHADNHFFGFQPGTDYLFSGNDGGIYKSENYGTTWKDMSGGLPIAQIYRIGTSRHSSAVITGMQDNGSNYRNNGAWSHVRGGDGMECIIDPNNPNIIYASSQRGAIYKSVNGGNNFKLILSGYTTKESGAWVTPYIISPHNPNVLYAGYINIWKSTNGGYKWTKISSFGNSKTNIISIIVAPSDSNVIYASKGRKLFRTTDGGNNWTKYFSGSNYITDIAVDYENPFRVWITSSNYTISKKVFELIEGEVRDITGSLPRVPASTIVCQNGTEGKLFVGTDLGVYYRDDFMDDWQPFYRGMPNIVIQELEIQYNTGKLIAATFSRGLWSTDISKCRIDRPKLIVTGQLDFCKGDSVIIEAAGDYDNYLWPGGESGKRITVKSSGVYGLAVKDADGCLGRSEEITVNVSEVEFSLSSEAPHCIGDTLALTADGDFDSVLWSTGDTTRSIIVTESGMYRAEASFLNGCSFDRDFKIEFMPRPPKPTITQKGRMLESTAAARYQWYLDGNKITGADKQTFEMAEIGLYSVEAINENGCGTFSDAFDVTTSVNDNPIITPELDIIPNPNSGNFHISIGGLQPGPCDLIISDVFGRRIVSYDLEPAGGSIEKEFDLQHLPAGLYLIQFANRSIRIHSKFIIR